jgi:hypothetical protein
MVLLEIIFVRHGVSCANAWGYISGLLEQIYPDPELSPYGIDRSEEKKEFLKKDVDSFFPDEIYSIAASCMIRTQQTAYHMLAKSTKKPIHIFPHIGEKINVRCNIPLSPKEQASILESEIVEQIGIDVRGNVDKHHRSNFSQFLTWVHGLNEKELGTFFGVGDLKGTPVYRAVIFTHGLFLKSIFSKKWFNNNDYAYVKIDTKTHSIMNYKRLTIFDDLSEKKAHTTGCQYPTYCSLAKCIFSRRKSSQKIRRNYTRRNYSISV